MPDIDTVWRRIVEHAGEVFHQVRGGAFTYIIESGQLRPDRTNQWLPRSQFEKALARLPLAGPAAVQNLRGPSYIFAILMDPRIRDGEW